MPRSSRCIRLDESCKEVDGCFHQSSPSNSIHRKFQFLCKSDECGPAANVHHYLKDTDEIQTQSVPCSCQGKKKQGMFRKLTKEEAYWFPAVPQGVKVMEYSLCVSYSPTLTFIYYSMQHVFILTDDTHLTTRNVADHEKLVEVVSI